MHVPKNSLIVSLDMSARCGDHRRFLPRYLELTVSHAWGHVQAIQWRRQLDQDVVGIRSKVFFVRVEFLHQPPHGFGLNRVGAEVPESGIGVQSAVVVVAQQPPEPVFEFQVDVGRPAFVTSQQSADEPSGGLLMPEGNPTLSSRRLGVVCRTL